LLFIERDIDPVEIKYLPQPAVETPAQPPTPDIMPEPTVSVTPTLQITDPVTVEEPPRRTFSPLTLGGGLVIVIIILLFVWRWYWNKRN
jgi:hypothetical protein